MNLNGTLDTEGLPVVSVRVRGPYGSRELRAYVDTCFGSNLSIPDSVVTSLGLPAANRIPLLDAAGGITICSTCLCQIMWDDRWQDLETVVGSDANALIGARPLNGRKLTIDYGAARSVEIE